METLIASPYIHRHRAGQRGQTIVVALVALLLLGFVGALFITIVTRNLQQAAHQNRVLTADYYAEAGIRYADEQLTHSIDGADWRPPLSCTLSSKYIPSEVRELNRYNAEVNLEGLKACNVSDPDAVYLNQGFTRYNIGGGANQTGPGATVEGGGRFLLRITYDPAAVTPQDSTAGAQVDSAQNLRYIKIEAVGREGVVNSFDPTTYENVGTTQAAATLVAYKPIGITDYARFETNPDKRSGVMNLGVSSIYSDDPNDSGLVTPGVEDWNGTGWELFPIVTSYGSSQAYTQATSTGASIPVPYVAGGPNPSIPGGGSFRANGSVRFFGENNFYLDDQPVAGTTVSTTTAIGDKIEVAGDLLLDNYNPGTTVTPYDLNNTAPTPPSLTGPQDALLQIYEPTLTTPYVVKPSNGVDPTQSNAETFDTFNGVVRDGSVTPDIYGIARSVNRLEPPDLDAVNPADNLPRYRDMALNSPPREEPSTSTTATPATYPATSGGESTSVLGYGQVIYIDNPTDVQPESNNVTGGYTLEDEWLNKSAPNATAGGAKYGWQGNFYNPPGADIVLGRQQRTIGGSTTPQSFYGVSITRSDVDSAGNPVQWTLPTGAAFEGTTPDGVTQSTMTVSYDDLFASNDPTVDPATYATNPSKLIPYTRNPNNDVIIYAEGNVRVHGVVSAPLNEPSGDDTTADGGAIPNDDQLPRHVTIVTNATAYIDGSVLKGNPDSSITILAHDYVCVNTTHFFAGPEIDQNPVGTEMPTILTGDPAATGYQFGASDELLLQDVLFANTAAYPNGINLFVSGAPTGVTGDAAAEFDFVDPATGYSVTSYGSTYNAPFGDIANIPPALDIWSSAPPTTSSLGVPVAANSANMARTVLPLSGAGDDMESTTGYGTYGTAGFQNYDFSAYVPDPDTYGDDYQLWTRRNPISVQPLLLDRVGIFPMDVRIEAVVYAATKSFFVIPGNWFNEDSADNTANFYTNYSAETPTPRNGFSTNDPNYVQENQFPFYGQPVDLQITIDGSVSEARPADIAAQTAWMLKWGWIPQYEGSPYLITPSGYTAPAGYTVPVSGHFATTGRMGLNMTYDPQDGFPYQPSTTATSDGAHYLRSDIYGRPLPYAPRLPVSSDLLYVGQTPALPSLQ